MRLRWFSQCFDADGGLSGLRPPRGDRRQRHQAERVRSLGGTDRREEIVAHPSARRLPADARRRTQAPATGIGGSPAAERSSQPRPAALISNLPAAREGGAIGATTLDRANCQSIRAPPGPAPRGHPGAVTTRHTMGKTIHWATKGTGNDSRTGIVREATIWSNIAMECTNLVGPAASRRSRPRGHGDAER